ncbi:MAG: 3'-5' exonuclease, partial [Aeromonas sp.]
HRLLSLAQDGQAHIGQAAVKAGDIAVLVRTGAEGKRVQRELARLNIASVYLSNRDSVFLQSEAQELLFVLRACQAPSDERSLRAALATALFDLDATALDEFAQDELRWEQLVQEFIGYRRLWQRRGVLAMLRALLARRQLAAVMLAAADGERRLTNYLHLAELLQQVSGELDGPFALLRWLEAALERPDGELDEQILRLESERKLVQIITIHKSKGLEYPLVFLPFVCDFRPASVALYHRDDAEADTTREPLSVLDLAASEAALAAADKERLAEDLRLLYVALTRGVYATWLGFAPLKAGRSKDAQTDLHKSAIGYLLQGGEAGDAQTLSSALANLAATLSGVNVCPPPSECPAPWVSQAGTRSAPTVRQFSAPLERDWWVSSYSGLAAHGNQHNKGVLTTPGFDDEGASSGVWQALAEGDTRSIFNFPRGARPGTLLHELFEQVDFTRVYPERLLAQATQALARRGFELDWAPILAEQVRAVLAAPLLADNGQTLRLNQIGNEAKQVELEFFLPMARVSAPALSALLAAHDPLSASCPALSFSAVQGMLKGFIDLVFEWQGRWYVLDYKSNHLGMTAADYRGEALTRAMAEHRYDLQYQLYSLALHRLLKARLADYDFARHFGGVFYLFLRGMPEHGVFYTRPSHALVTGLDALFAHGDATSAAFTPDPQEML